MTFTQAKSQYLQSIVRSREYNTTLLCFINLEITYITVNSVEFLSDERLQRMT